MSITACVYESEKNLPVDPISEYNSLIAPNGVVRRLRKETAWLIGEYDKPTFLGSRLFGRGAFLGYPYLRFIPIQPPGEKDAGQAYISRWNSSNVTVFSQKNLPLEAKIKFAMDRILKDDHSKEFILWVYSSYFLHVEDFLSEKGIDILKLNY